MSHNQSQGICSQTSISLTHITKVIGFGTYDKYQSLRQIQKRKEIKAEDETSGVRNLGISSNDYLVWLVHKPAADQVSSVIKVQPQYINS